MNDLDPWLDDQKFEEFLDSHSGTYVIHSYMADNGWIVCEHHIVFESMREFNAWFQAQKQGHWGLESSPDRVRSLMYDQGSCANPQDTRYVRAYLKNKRLQKQRQIVAERRAKEREAEHQKVMARRAAKALRLHGTTDDHFAEAMAMAGKQSRVPKKKKKNVIRHHEKGERPTDIDSTKIANSGRMLFRQASH
uniref:Uncharacterized protein n=1 Tax=Octactis speculum TaxID=3111310 RepID=A0A7S2FY27_9STRA|mmetsp:Transcript_33640/g.45492  ORF Transcript_33640/g.45492 Transcript_33640/m.45492 type:complete len:193 (+) Transcript_33640:36-614(+)|eukprot:CAMPEP_0185749098 /NCGR_PEP_ID=MMETSP1174-20130828/7840_1 /TAXON_ID=35687 /ORGANISM="Dictyocha speculum, Strain CCMP1381" /LENGTH=192 /DNA_ID=CAMNT_0028425081 /DNA_START=29 /DNA_END=607 /DNA_ORIENTATION=+